MSATQLVKCEQCGASTPLISTKENYCLFCDSLVSVPHGMQIPLEEQQKIENEMLSVVETIRQAKEGRISEKWIYGVIGVVSVGCYLNAMVEIMSSSKTGESDPGLALPLIIMGLCAVCVPAIFFGIFLYYHRALTSTFVAAPWVRLDVTDKIKAYCGACGAEVTTTGDILVECNHCKVESILPAMMIEETYRQKYKRLMEKRQKFEQLAQLPFASSNVIFWPLGILAVGIAVTILFFSIGY